MRWLLVLLTASVMLVAPGAGATTVVSMTPAELLARSDVVVQGVVLEQHARFVGRRIFTFSTVRVDRVLRGAMPPGEHTVVVATHGGVVGTRGQKVPGAPQLQVGARYLACLGATDGPEGARGVVGFGQGLWRADDAAALAAAQAALELDAGTTP